MNTKHMASPALLADFRAVSRGKSRAKTARARTTAPFSVRLTLDERACLEQQAGNQHLGSYIRERLLNEQAQQRRISRKPKVDDKNLAIVLSLFGDQRIASNLNQLAKHANMGTLDVSDGEIAKLQEACATMIAVRNYLLGIKPDQAKDQ